MKSLVVVLALASSGCFTSWAAMQTGGKTLAWDENVRQESVPLPGVEERLTVTLRDGETQVSCITAQHGKDAVYRSSVRYGKGWKKGTALMFAAEAAAATVFLLGDREKKENLVYGGFLALDAVGTAALFFAPRKESFTRSELESRTPVREDCPDGLTLEIAGTTFPVDAAGKLGEAGEVALDDWRKMQHGALLVGFAGRTNQLRATGIGAHAIHAGTIDVPVGTLTAHAE